MADISPDPSKNPKENVYVQPLKRLARTLIEVLVHIVIVLAVLGGLKVVENWMAYLWGSNEYMFFDWLKMRYIFDGADVSIIVGFCGIGIYHMLKAYKK